MNLKKQLGLVWETFRLLGREVEDKVTKTKGVVTSVSFDLYGCVQAWVTPSINAKEKPEAVWHDVKRLTVLKKKAVMPMPQFMQLAFGDENGPEAKGPPR